MTGLFADERCELNAKVAGLSLRSGVKTGCTEAAGKTLVNCAERKEMILFCVALNDTIDWMDHTALPNVSIDKCNVVSPEQQKQSIPVIFGGAEGVNPFPAEACAALIPLGVRLKWRTKLPKSVYIP